MCNEGAGDISESMLFCHLVNVAGRYRRSWFFFRHWNPAITGALFPNYCVCTGEPVGAQQRDACSSMTTLFFGDGEDRSKSAAVPAEINGTPFVMKWLPEIRRGRGKESRHSRVKGGSQQGRGASRWVGGWLQVQMRLVRGVSGGGKTGTTFGLTLRLMEWLACWVWTPGE